MNGDLSKVRTRWPSCQVDERPTEDFMNVLLTHRSSYYYYSFASIYDKTYYTIIYVKRYMHIFDYRSHTTFWILLYPYLPIKTSFPHLHNSQLRQGFPEGETGRQFLQRILQGLRQAAKLGEVQWWIFWKVHPQNRWITVTGVVSPL